MKETIYWFRLALRSKFRLVLHAIWSWSFLRYNARFDLDGPIEGEPDEFFKELEARFKAKGKDSLKTLLNYTLDAIFSENSNEIGPRGETVHQIRLPLLLVIDLDYKYHDYLWTVQVYDGGRWLMAKEESMEAASEEEAEEGRLS